MSRIRRFGRFATPILIAWDTSIDDLLNRVDAGEAELDRGEYIRLSWLSYWAEVIYATNSPSDVAMLNFVKAIRGGVHPPNVADPTTLRS